MKKVGKNTGPFRYDLNKIPYDYIVKVTNRFKGLDLIECLKNYGWRFMFVLYNNIVHCTGGSDQNHSKEKEMQEGKVIIYRGFTNS